MSPDKLVNVVIMLLVFGLIFSVWGICICLWIVQYLRKARSARAKLGLDDKQEGEDESSMLRLWFDSYEEKKPTKAVKKKSLAVYLDKMIAQTGWHASVRTIILRILAAIGLTSVIAYFVSGDIVVGFGAAAVAIFIAWTFIQKRIAKQTALFERQLADALGISSRALRAGHPLVETFQLIADEIGEPLGDIFARICQEQSLGLGLKDSIRNVAETTYNNELKLFATAISIQFQSGGNLADLMDRLASVIRARMRLNRRIRVITAQTQFSKKVLIALPIMLFFLLNVVNAEYMQPLYNTVAGKAMLIIGSASVLMGTWMMNRLSAIKL
ncbi:MAG: type II secretion system F family protein [Sedimentisphaerales bacterium]|nr:type II secretion system F family protein [Sedimentisphaerales bacterium]